MDTTTLIGILLGISCIVLGQRLEGGELNSIVQLAAFVIVIGGTAGAVVAQFPLPELRRDVIESRRIFVARKSDLGLVIRRIVVLSRSSRKEGLLVLEKMAAEEPDPFLARSLLAVVDAQDGPGLRALLENEIDQERHQLDAGPRLFDAAGGYAPTIGILGAVLGLIHVMENLGEPSRLGAGIAVAFVATLYGVGSANLIFLPLAQKLRTKIEWETRRKEMIIEGLCAIKDGANPQMIERRLQGYVIHDAASQ